MKKLNYCEIKINMLFHKYDESFLPHSNLANKKNIKTLQNDTPRQILQIQKTQNQINILKKISIKVDLK